MSLVSLVLSEMAMMIVLKPYSEVLSGLFLVAIISELVAMTFYLYSVKLLNHYQEELNSMMVNICLSTSQEDRSSQMMEYLSEHDPVKLAFRRFP
jgi:hypothetical protein